MSQNEVPVPQGIAASIRQCADSVVLRLEWKNYRVRRDWALVAVYLFAWLAFATASAWVTYCVFFARPEGGTALQKLVGWLFIGAWLIGGWAITLGVSYILLGLSWSEWIEISGRAFSYGAKGLLAPKPVTLVLEEVRELFLGHCGEPGDRDSFLTFNVFSSRGRARWGDWLAPGLKVEVFEFIEVFVRAYNIPMPVRLGNSDLRILGKGLAWRADALPVRHPEPGAAADRSRA